MSKIPSPPNGEFSWVSGRFFLVPEEIVYSFFNALFDVFWGSIKLAYVSKLGEEGLGYDYLFTSQRETHSVPDMDFLLNLCLFCPIWSY